MVITVARLACGTKPVDFFQQQKNAPTCSLQLSYIFLVKGSVSSDSSNTHQSKIKHSTLLFIIIIIQFQNIHQTKITQNHVVLYNIKKEKCILHLIYVQAKQQPAQSIFVKCGKISLGGFC